MLVHKLGNEARDARIFTQRIYGQCRKTASSWRVLSQALRRLRNSIEELEDLILDEALGKRSTAPILTSLQACVHVLRHLDQQLQFYRNSTALSQPDIEQTVAGFNTSLAKTTATFEQAYRDSLSANVNLATDDVSTVDAHDGAVLDREIMAPALQPDEIIICLDDQMPLDEVAYTASVKGESSSLPTAPAPTSLQLNSQLSTSNQDLEGRPPAGRDHPEHHASREQKPAGSLSISSKPREIEIDAAYFPLPESPVDPTSGRPDNTVWFEDAIVPQDSQKLRFVSPLTSSLKPSQFSWQSPFAEIDPLSVDFESATSFLLGTPRTSSETQRSGYASHNASAEAQRTAADTSAAKSSSHPADLPQQSPHPSSGGTRVLNLAGSDGESLHDCNDRRTRKDQSSSPSRPDISVNSNSREHIEHDSRPSFNTSNDSTSNEIEISGQHSESVNEHIEVLFNSERPEPTEAKASFDVDASQGALPTPASKFASDHYQSGSRLSAESGWQTASRTDSKMDLQFSAPTSPSGSSIESRRRRRNQPVVPSTASQATAQSEWTSTTAAAMDDISRSSLEVTFDVRDAQQARLRSTSETTIPQLNILTELKRAPPPPPLPPKGRYHIVNPSPHSRIQSMDGPVLPPRPTSPEMETSGEIPMILVQESQPSIAAHTRVLPAEQIEKSTPDVRPASRGVTSPTSPQARRYYRQSFVRANRRTSQTPEQSEVPAKTDTTTSDHTSFVEEAFQEPSDVRLITVDSICHSWTRQEWTRAEAYLLAYYELCIASDDSNTVRRIRHLLGVSASFQGQWQRAISYFISSLNVPLKEASSIDEGDRAALIWLADCYVLCNRRLEAFVANTLVMQGLASQSKQSDLLTILYAEQKAILAGGSAAQLELKWNQLTTERIAATSDTIVSHDVVSPNLIEICFNQPAGNPGQLPKPTTPLPRNRATILCELDNHNTPLAAHMEFKITHDSFHPEAPWPLPYDPFFAAEQAAKGRLCDQPCDLLTMVKSTPPIKIPKNGPLGSSRFACFTCGDLEWLIASVRDCLRYMEMKWDEVANAQGVWFTARFAMRHQNVLTAVYFAISLFKQSMRQGYGIEVCVDGVRSARVMHDSLEYPMGVHYSCEKRLKKFFQEYLSKAHRHWFKGGKAVGSLPATEVISGELARDAHQFMASKAQRVVAKDLPSLPKSELARYA